MNYLIAKANIEFDLLSEDMNNRIKKYESDSSTSTYFCHSQIVDEIYIPKEKPLVLSKYYALYEINGNKYEIIIDNQKHLLGSILFEGNKVTLNMTKGNLDIKEYVLSETAGIYFILKDQEGLFIHSSCFKYSDYGILLIATSGTGKSTHARLWKEYENIIQINDDKNIIINDNNQLTIYPNPWSGKHEIDNNVSNKLTHLVFVHRGLDNKVTKLNKMQTFKELLPHIQNTSFYYPREKWDKMTDSIINNTCGLSLSCDISKEAYLALKEALEDSK